MYKRINASNHFYLETNCQFFSRGEPASYILLLRRQYNPLPLTYLTISPRIQMGHRQDIDKIQMKPPTVLSDMYLLGDSVIFYYILIFKGLQVYLLSLGFYKVYKLEEILIIILRVILELFYITILYNIQIPDLILQKGLQLQLQLYNNLIFIKLIKYNPVQ